MSQRNVSVLVLPDRWDGSAEELAQRLVSLTHQSADRLSTALERGPLTIDADLRPEEAERVCAQLERLGVPAEARAADGTVVVETDGAATDREPEVAGEDRDEEGAEFEEFDEFGAAIDSVVESAEVTSDSEADFDGLESVDGAIDEEKAAAEDRNASESGGWGEVLETGTVPSDGDDVGTEPADADATPGGDGSGGGLTLLEDGDDEAPSLEDLGGDDSEPSDSDSSDESRPPQPPSPGPPGADAGPAGVPPAETGDAPGGTTSETNPASGLEASDASEPDSPLGPAPPGPPAAEEDESDFDTVGMTEALSESTDEGQFQNGTFDDRPEHVPALAAVLSLLAPGAGQIYNGQPEEAWEHALYAPLIWPWYRSVRDALERGRAIRKREMPKPESGTFVASLKHIAILYVAVTGFAVAGYLGVGLIAANWSEQPTEQPAMTELDVRRALQNGRLRLHDARITAWEEVGRRRGAVDERDTGVEDPTAEAERLFGMGYAHCRERELEKCEETMRRVTRLDSSYRRQAYRLQTWANMQQNPEVSHRDMPDVEYRPGSSSGDEVDEAAAGADTEPTAGDEAAADADDGSTPGNVADDVDAATLSNDSGAGHDTGAAERPGD